jgi:AcrR family transcriptional regulator
LVNQVPLRYTSGKKRLGRPVGGGNEPGRAREVLLDAAERALIKFGYRALTMESVAREGGYTRAIVYRHFPTRNDLFEGLLRRGTLRVIKRVKNKAGPSADFATLVTESLVMVGTKLADDPLHAVLAEYTDTGAVATVLSNARRYTDFVESLLQPLVGEDLRDGLHTDDVAQFLVMVAMNLLLGMVPGSDDPDQVRRYVAVFVLPAVLRDPPAAGPVFHHGDG